MAKQLSGLHITQYQFFTNLTQLFFIEEIWLYGSRARGNQRERSDIDLAIVCPQANTQDWQKVLAILDEADTLLQIDCIRFDTLKDDEPLKQNIIADKVILFKRNQHE